MTFLEEIDKHNDAVVLFHQKRNNIAKLAYEKYYSNNSIIPDAFNKLPASEINKWLDVVTVIIKAQDKLEN